MCEALKSWAPLFGWGISAGIYFNCILLGSAVGWSLLGELDDEDDGSEEVNDDWWI